MFNSKSNHNTIIAYDKLIIELSKLPQEKIDEAIKKARAMGISENYISQGLEFINKAKKEIIEEK